MPSQYLDIPEDVVDITQKIGLSASTYDEVCIRANTAYVVMTDSLLQAKKDGTITNDEYKRAREIYRGMLPQHNMTETVVTFNMRSLGHFMGLRNKPTAQPEIKQMAQMMLDLVLALPEFEHSAKAMLLK